MQKNTKMTPKNPTNSDPKTHFQEPEKPLINNPSEIINNSESSESTQEVEQETGELSVVLKNKNRASPPEKEAEDGRERLKRHRVEVAGRVWIPDMWGQEGLLKDWIDCAAFDASLVNSSIMSARDSLAAEGRRANSTRLSVQNSC